MKARIVKSDFRKLNAFVKGLDDKHIVKVGVLQKKTHRDDDPNVSNADLGAIHEFGTKDGRIPARSWLMMPIRKNAKKILTAAGKGALEILAAGKKVLLLKSLGINCEKNINQAFETEGFGSWKPLKDPTRGGKNADGGAMPLVDTGQLKRSVDSAVVNR